MAQRMRHYTGGPLDGHIEVVDDPPHPFLVEFSGTTDGYYVLEYQVAGRRLGDLTLTADDMIARWRQRTSPTDFMTGDQVVVIATEQRGSVVAPWTRVFEDGPPEEGWMVSDGTRVVFVVAEQIRLLTAEELRGEDPDGQESGG